VIALVAAFMLLVIGGMMALSIDVVTFYTARSEAQLAADGAALAAARVLANSGVTSTLGSPDPSAAQFIATRVAKDVAKGNTIGGANILGPNVTVSYNSAAATFETDPQVTVTVTRTDLPTFFARILGTQKITVTASATAEAYNPSSTTPASARSGPPVAPLCVKPWLLPNLDPTQLSTGTTPLFDRTNGAITNGALVGQEWPSSTPTQNQEGLYDLCKGDCSATIPAAVPGGYYPVVVDAVGTSNPGDFPTPTQALPSCSGGFTQPYQFAVAACVQTPVSCGPNAGITVNIDASTYRTGGDSRNIDTVAAAGCLIHYTAAGDSDSIDTLYTTPPFQFVGGNQNPIANAVAKDIMVSDSLVTIPVIDDPSPNPAPTPSSPGVTVIGFLQVFLNPSATKGYPYATGLSSPNEIPATIINIAGCGAAASGLTPIQGNGASPVAVRLISPP
jgi:Flp pilus assembly protein TadG